MNKQKFIYESGKDFKKNVIIMGDILEDVKMVNESVHNVVLKIGFLNEPKTHSVLIEEFKKIYDIIIVGDGSLMPVNYLLRKMFL